jgi:signal transduction histidine kinase
MKKPGGTALTLIVLYLVSTVLLLLFICLYPLTQQKRAMNYIVQMTLKEYRESPDGSLPVNPDVRRQIFDGAGQCLADSAPDVTWPLSVPEGLQERALNRSSEGKRSFYPCFERSMNDLLVMYAAPMEQEGTFTGTVLLIRNLKNLPESMEGAAVCYTLLYWLFAAFALRLLQKKRRLERMQENYVANVTHALKAPIASVKALTEALTDVVEADPDKQRPYFGMILRETNLQNHMVQEILALSKLQNRGMDFTKTQVSAQQALAPMVEKYSVLCELAQVRFQVDPQIESLPPLYTNETCFRQVLEILLENAVKFVPAQGMVSIGVKRSKQRATFSVENTGEGIAPEDLPHIFERFYVGERGRGEGSSGLGLAIAQAIAAGLKEKLWAESAVGKGAAFYFTVRLK